MENKEIILAIRKKIMSVNDIKKEVEELKIQLANRKVPEVSDKENQTDVPKVPKIRNFGTQTEKTEDKSNATPKKPKISFFQSKGLFTKKQILKPINLTESEKVLPNASQVRQGSPKIVQEFNKSSEKNQEKYQNLIENSEESPEILQESIHDLSTNSVDPDADTECESEGIQEAIDPWGDIDTDFMSQPEMEIQEIKSVSKEKEISKEKAEEDREISDENSDLIPQDQGGSRHLTPNSTAKKPMPKTGPKKFQCRHCSSTFAYKSLLKIHYGRVHLKIKNFQCRYCQKSFNTKGNMKTHVKTIHKKLKPYKCEKCGKSFAQKINMKIHVKKHHKSKKVSFALDVNFLKDSKLY